MRIPYREEIEQPMNDTVQAAYEAHADLLYRLALSHLHHSEDAMDAVHDVFLKFADTPRSFQSEEHERAWFVRVTINRCHDLLRRRRLRLHDSIDDHHETAAPVDNTRPAVLETVDRLSENLKDVVVLHYLEGFSVEETARLLKLSVSAVKMRLSRARDTLRSAIEKEGL